MRVSQQDHVCAVLSSDKIMTTFVSHATEILKVILVILGDATFSLCDMSGKK